MTSFETRYHEHPDYPQQLQRGGNRCVDAAGDLSGFAGSGASGARFHASVHRVNPGHQRRYRYVGLRHGGVPGRRRHDSACGTPGGQVARAYSGHQFRSSWIPGQLERGRRGSHRGGRARWRCDARRARQPPRGPHFRGQRGGKPLRAERVLGHARCAGSHHRFRFGHFGQPYRGYARRRPGGVFRYGLYRLCAFRGRPAMVLRARFRHARAAECEGGLAVTCVRLRLLRAGAPSSKGARDPFHLLR